MNEPREIEAGYDAAFSTHVGVLSHDASKALQAFCASTSDLQRVAFAHHWMNRLATRLPETYKALYELGLAIRENKLWTQPDPEQRVFDSFEAYWETYFGESFRLLLQLENTYQFFPKEIRMGLNSKALSPDKHLEAARELFAELEERKAAVVVTEKRLRELFGVNGVTGVTPQTQLALPGVVAVPPLPPVAPKSVQKLVLKERQTSKSKLTVGAGSRAVELLAKNPKMPIKALARELYGAEDRPATTRAHGLKAYLLRVGRLKRTEAGYEVVR